MNDVDKKVWFKVADAVMFSVFCATCVTLECVGVGAGKLWTLVVIWAILL